MFPAGFENLAQNMSQFQSTMNQFQSLMNGGGSDNSSTVDCAKIAQIVCVAAMGIFAALSAIFLLTSSPVMAIFTLSAAFISFELFTIANNVEQLYTIPLAGQLARLNNELFINAITNGTCISKAVLKCCPKLLNIFN